MTHAFMIPSILYSTMHLQNAGVLASSCAICSTVAHEHAINTRIVMKIMG